MSTDFEDLIMRGTRGAQPAASIPGRLYYVTDEVLLERDSGVAWENVEGTGGTGIGETGWVDTGEAWTYASSDDPTYTITIVGDLTSKYSSGMRIRLTDSGTQYFIITKVSYGAPNTTLTLYGGTDYDLSGGAITSPYYSTVKAPFGFPLDTTKWTVRVTDAADRAQAPPAAGTWYNLGAITISLPIGVWLVNYQVAMDISMTSGVPVAYSTLSTANNSESDIDFTAVGLLQAAASGGAIRFIQTWHRRKTLVIASKTSYYLNGKTSAAAVSTIDFRGDLATTVIEAICAYL